MEGVSRNGEREELTPEELALKAWRSAVLYQRRLREFSQLPGVEVRRSHSERVEAEVSEARAAYQELTGHDVPEDQLEPTAPETESVEDHSP